MYIRMGLQCTFEFLLIIIYIILQWSFDRIKWELLQNYRVDLSN